MRHDAMPIGVKIVVFRQLLAAQHWIEGLGVEIAIIDLVSAIAQNRHYAGVEGRVEARFQRMGVDDEHSHENAPSAGLPVWQVEMISITRRPRQLSDQRNSFFSTCVISTSGLLSGGRHPPYRITDVVGDQQCA
jgi:hypothetical protein